MTNDKTRNSLDVVLDVLPGDRPLVLGVTGDDDAAVAHAAVAIYRRLPLACLVFLPSRASLSPAELGALGLELVLELGLDGAHVHATGVAGLAATAGYSIGFFTSGSTGKAKLVLMSREAIELTVQWYRHIYDLDSRSCVVSSLPATYNFTVVAGICASAVLGSELRFQRNPESAQQLPRDRRVVLLANPVTLAHVAGVAARLEVALVDSGGAALSRSSLRWFRENIADLREGYGLTETCSLTHFDSLGTRESEGSVGCGLAGVQTEIRSVDGKPLVHVRTPNAGAIFDFASASARPIAEPLCTHDLGQLLPGGQLRLLGRSDDHQVNGLWPKDTLDAVGEYFDFCSALVQHPDPEHIVVKLYGEVSATRASALQRDVAERARLPLDGVRILRSAGLLHSLKLPRRLDPA